MTRKARTANVEEHPKGSGLYRVRARIGGRLVTVASKLPERLAIETANKYGELQSAGELSHGITLGQFGAGYLDRRAKLGSRSKREDESRWKTLIDQDELGKIALASLQRPDVVIWRDRLLARVSGESVKRALSLLRVALADALDRGLVAENVARDVRVPRRLGATDEEDLTGVLVPVEQMALLAAVPDEHKPLVAVGLLSGLRWSELSWLRREDLAGAELIVRRSAGGGPTKSGKPRRVPLLGPASVALEVQLASLDEDCPWVFPGSHGAPRKQRPLDWPEWVKAAGIERRVRWHDLRHTCATSLLAGWWSEDGARWTLDEVCSMLGHSSINVTERYARKLDETLALAAKKTRFPGGNGSGGNLAKSGGAQGLSNPLVGGSNPSGRAAGKLPDPRALPAASGTSGELPNALKNALRKTTTRTAEGRLYRQIAKAWPAICRGAEDKATVALAAALEELRLHAEGA